MKEEWSLYSYEKDKIAQNTPRITKLVNNSATLNKAVIG